MADFRPTKVETRSRRYGTELVQHTISPAKEATANTLEIDENDKAIWKSRFNDIYETVFRDCVCIDGQDWSEVNDETTEFEPVDLEKKEYINGELTNQLHGAVLEVAIKRKRCPSKNKSTLSKLNAAELRRLGQLKVVCNSNVEPLNPPDSVMTSDEVLNRLKETESSLSSLHKSVRSQVTKGENLKTVQKMYRKNQNSTIMDNVKNTPGKLDVSCKKLRFSPRLHSDRKPRTRLKLS